MERTPSTTDSDHDVVERAQQGDHRAFAELVSRHDPRLRALARRLLGTPDRADDALQDAYLKAFRHLGRFRRDADVATWLYRITYNTCLDELRRRPVEAIPGDEPDRPSAERGPAERAVARTELAAALGRLSPDLRTTVVLVHGYGFDYAEASRLLGVPSGTVASRLHRARRRMQPAVSGTGRGVAADAA